MKKLLAFSLACIMLFAMAACAPEDSGTTTTTAPSSSSGTTTKPADTTSGSQTGGEKIVRCGRELSSLGNLDVWLTTYNIIFEHSDAILDRLIDKNPDTLDLELNLLESFPTLSDDGLTYSFKLKEGVKFHDGTELTTEDVEFTFIRFFYRDGASVNAELVAMIKGADAMMKGEATTLEGFEIVDKYNFNITLEYPYTAFESILSISMLPILPKKACTEAGDKWGIDVFIGSGPYILKEFTPFVKLRMDKNPDYHGKVPEVDAIEVIHMDYDTALLEWEAGTIDIAVFQSLELVADYQARFPNNVLGQEYVGTIWLQLNQDLEPLNNLKVRQAIAHATDKSEIVQGYKDGYVKTANTILPNGIPGHNPNAPDNVYDVELAKTLLAEAGYPEGFTMTATCRDVSTSTQEMLQILKQQYAKVGITLEIEMVDAAGWLDKRSNGNVMFWFGNWYADYIDGDMYMFSLFHSQFATFFSTGFRNDWWDEQVMYARTLSGQEKIDQYMMMDNYLVYEDYAIIPLYQDKGFMLQSDRVEGVFLKKDMLFTYTGAQIVE